MKKFKFALIITVLVFGVITGLHLLGVFHYLEYKSYDMRVRFWASPKRHSRPSDDIVLILVDQDSIDWARKERGWGWPWPRQAYSEIVDYMNMSRANGIAFDVIFSEPSVYRVANQDEIIDNAVVTLEELEQSGYFETRDPNQQRDRSENRTPTGNRQRTLTIIDALRSLRSRQDDVFFIEASERYGRVVQAVMFSATSGNETAWPENLDKPMFRPENFGSLLERFRVEGHEERAQFPIQGLSESARVLGSVYGTADTTDGIYRRLRPFTLFDGKSIPGLSAGLLVASGKGTQIIYNEKNREIQWEDLIIPIDKNGYALLRFRGDLNRYIPYKAKDILLSYESIERGEELSVGEYLTEKGSTWAMYTPDNFEDKYVFFGVDAQGLFDIFPTPISSVYPGVGAHVTMLDNMLMGDFIRESTEVFNIILLLIVVVIIVWLTMFSQRISMSLIGTFFIVTVIIISAFTAYQYQGLWLPMVTYLAGTLASFVTVTLYNYATEGSQKRFIKSAFSQYLSPKVIEQIIQDPSQLKLGGEKREMTAIFTDVRGFSTFSEALGDPSKLVELLNFYLTKMSNIVLDNQGTIDKYEGDAIIAFFGAPIHYDNHASLACRAVIGMKKAEPEINREAIETGLVTPAVMEAMYKKGLTKSLDDPCQIFTRIGMNTGDMVVGNMGTPNKMDYTIMGNAVNLAARLEGVNKQYDTGGILISEYTHAQLSASGHGDEFIVRPLSRVRVVGINTPLRLYELLDVASEASPELLKMVKNWTQAFDLYEKKDFLGAKNIFGSICTNNPNDMAAKKYLNRCIKYIDVPPDEKAWDNGVDNLTEK